MQPSFWCLFTDNTVQCATKQNVQERGIRLKHQDSVWWYYSDKTITDAEGERGKDSKRYRMFALPYSCWKCQPVLYCTENYLSCERKVHNWNEQGIPGFSLIKCQLTKNIDSNPFRTPNLQLHLLWSFWWSLSQNMFTGIGSLEPIGTPIMALN